MEGKNSNRKVESSLKRTSFLGHLGLIVGAYRELEVGVFLIFSGSSRVVEKWRDSTQIN
jgi:hypothetical protein